MHRLNICICLALCMNIWNVAEVYSVTDWDLDLLRFEHNTSNAEIVDFKFRIIRSKAGVYALNGSLFTGVEIDDTFSAGLKVYRSQSGNSQYRATPFEIPTTTFYTFMTNVYVKLLQTEFSQCSNMPVHEKEFNTPLQATTYNINMCVMSSSNMPGHIQPGLYRVTVHVFKNDFDLWFSGFFDVHSKYLA